MIFLKEVMTIWWILFLLLGAVFLAYCPIPHYWMRNHSKKVFRKGIEDKKEVYLTFDDGPNPDYTPRLLDILKKYDIKASFFVIGREAKSWPDIIKRIYMEGHTLGCHSYSHNHAWLMSPFRTYVDMKNTRDILSDIQGESPNWYRPPWGGFNLFTILATKKHKLRIAYWSVEAKDWASDTSVDQIRDIIIKKVRPGSLIVLHDNQGAPNAPEKMLKALPQIIEILKDRGYNFVSLDEMGVKPC